FRSLIPESIAGANSAARFETWGLSLEQRVGRGTFLALGGEILDSKVNRNLGAYTFSLSPTPTLAASDIKERLDFTERSIFVAANQLVARDWSLGARYRLSQAELRDEFRGFSASPIFASGFSPERDVEGVLHRVDLFTIWNHPSGLFAEAQAIWYAQHSQG